MTKQHSGMLRRLLKGIRPASPNPSTREITHSEFTSSEGAVLRLRMLEFEQAPQIGRVAALHLSCLNDSPVPTPSVLIVLLWRHADGDRMPLLARQPLGWLDALAPHAEASFTAEFSVPINSALPVEIAVSLEMPDGVPLQAQDIPIRLCRQLIGASSGTDFDYRDAYAQADLDKDWWSIVGPATLDEYIVQGKRKLEQLKRFGLHPDARFLDIGCGTGQVTEQLVAYLSPSASYVGTDVAEEAVTFCRRRFPRENFHFFRNEGATLPIRGQEFDIIYLASVFTHLTLAEIRIMLAEIHRLLARNGWVLLDAFVLSSHEEQSGNRSMMRINEAALQRAFKDQGFIWQEVGSAPWNAECRRVVYRLGQAARPDQTGH